MPTSTHVRLRATTLLVAVLLLLAGWSTRPLPAHADTAPVGTQPATVSADALPTWQVDGVVYAQVVVGTTVYATGLFSSARPPGVARGGTGETTVGNLIAYDIRTGNRIASFAHTLDAQGLAITASPDGSRVYVGGDFTTVDGVSRPHVAAFDTATGALVAGFAPVLDGQVKALTATNTTVYAGGSFTAVTRAGTVHPRRFLASFGAADGAVTTWAPRADNGYAWALTLTPDRTRVIAGGQFQTVNGVTVNGMAALDATSGAVRPWAANGVVKDYHQGAIDTLSTDGTTVYGGGFAFGDGGSFEGSFALDPADGSIRWLVDCQGDTYGVQPVGPVLYTVGHTHDCTMIGAFPDTDPRTRWQSGTAFTTVASGVNSGPDTYGWSYAGRPAAALLHWFPKLALGTATGQYQAAWTVTAGAGYVALGGEFPKVNDADQQGLTRFATSAVAPDRVGPKYDDTAPVRTAAPATTATRTATRTIRVAYGSAWDPDNTRLTYTVYRDRGTAAEKVVATRTVDGSFWVLPAQTVTDTDVPDGSHRYQVRVTDPSGNALLSPVSNQLTIGGNLAPTAAFTSTVAGRTATFSGAASADPDGRVTSYAWSFGDGTSGSGSKVSHTYAKAGPVTVRLTVTDDGGATGTTTRTVTVGQAAPRVQDTFTRTVTGGWGSAEIGGTWTPVGSSSLFSVAGGQGRTTLNAGSGPSQELAASATDTDLSLTYGFDKPATGGGLFVRTVARGDATNGYLAKVWVSGTSQAATLYLTRARSGVETNLADVVLPGTFAAGTRYHLRVQAVGSGTTTLRARVWTDGTTEPTTWALSTSDTTAALQAAGGVAVHGYASGSVTNAPVTLSVDDVVVRPSGG